MSHPFPTGHQALGVWEEAELFCFFFWQSVGSTIGFPVHILVQSSTQFYYSMMTLFNFCVIKCDLGKKNQFTFVTFDQWLMYQKKVFSKF